MGIRIQGLSSMMIPPLMGGVIFVQSGKGGTLDRFSEDMDLDGKGVSFYMIRTVFYIEGCGAEKQ